MLSEIRLYTDAWYGDCEIALPAPPEWDITTIRPETPAPLSDWQIRRALAHPVRQAPLRQLCSGKLRPLVIIDDLNRPTPADRLLPFLLEEFAQGGIPREQVRILLASGSHSAPTREEVARKVGAEAASCCRVFVHDAKRNCCPVAKTSFGTPVLVSAEVLASDFVVGVGGIYSSHTAGYGGGSNLAIGVLGLKSILHLHHKHESNGWGSLRPGQNTFRMDLDEIARIIGLDTIVTVHVNTRRQVVRVVSGDHFQYYPTEVQFSRNCFSVPPAGPADVIVSNAYPNDLTLTFAGMKGMLPFRKALPTASRIAIASCRGGIGVHELFPVQARPNPLAHAVRTIRAMGPKRLARAIEHRIARKTRPCRSELAPLYPLWLLPTVASKTRSVLALPGMQIASSWADVVAAVTREQAGKDRVQVQVYACAPLQQIDSSSEAELAPDASETELAATAVGSAF